MNRATVEQFKQQCKTFDEDATSDDALQLGHIVEEELPATYQVPFETMNASPSLLEKVHARHYRGLWHELVQHLTDLGYLTEHQFITYHKLRKNTPDEPRLLVPVLQATVQYLGEENWPVLAQMFKGKLSDIQLPHLEEHLGHVVERIARYTSFDGSLPPPDDYQVGDVNCYGRSLAFRVRTLFTLDKALQHIYIFERSHLKFLYSFQNLIGLKFLPKTTKPEEIVLPEECWTMLCNIDGLFTRFKDARPKDISVNNIVLSYALNAKENMQSDAEESDEQADDEKRFLKGRERRRGRKMTKASKALENTGYHEMAIRILQVKLWQTHFYIGAVDGKWGDKSHEAVEGLIEQETEVRPKKNNGKLKRKDRLAIARAFFQSPADATGDATIVIGFNAMYELLQQYHAAAHGIKQSNVSEEDEMVKQLVELQKKVVTPVENHTDSRRDRRRNNRQNNNEENSKDHDYSELDDRILNSDDFKELYPDLIEKPQRRVAFARKSFLSGIKRGFSRIVNWIKKGLKKLLGPVFGFFKLITGKIRAGIQQFFRGFRYLGHFLLGRPIVTYAKPSTDSDTLDILATKFSLDFDGINLISSTAAPADIKRHVNHIHDMKDSMFYFIDTTLKIIKMISKLTQPGGWVLLGWQIARMIAGELVDVLTSA
ncbi:peptidoglycan-binding domain-containing protein [Lewinella cohaerens]|uniref:peptidoglycan-binding domain-containing protein n=1 Tax=Lewinella cohaerens TaxID=70995 RepID=UPI000377C54C|nr:hypothetical protein [Lewinella cohaerens]